MRTDSTTPDCAKLERNARARSLLVLGALSAVGCRAPYDPQRVPMQVEPAPIAAPILEPNVEEPPPAVNQDIVICGRHVPIGAPVVLWTEPPFYDASRKGPRFSKPKPDAVEQLRYQPGRVRKHPNPDYSAPPKDGEIDTRAENERSATLDEVLVAPDATDASALCEVVDQFVLHFDVCGISRTCFRVLQDERILSVHFLLDVDGTLYQTLDLREMAWHATKSNARSIGVEIAQIGAYPARETWRLDPWYEELENETRLSFPARIKETGIRTKEFVGRTARQERLVGRIQGETLHQYDFTPEQYQSLVKLTAALCREFPKLRAEAPRDESGAVLDHVLDEDAWEEFHGILGHYHVQKNKTDPGPAFDWDPFLAAVRAQLVVSHQ